MGCLSAAEDFAFLLDKAESSAARFLLFGGGGAMAEKKRGKRVGRKRGELAKIQRRGKRGVREGKEVGGDIVWLPS